MTGIIAMMMMRARTEIREIRRAGENVRFGNGRIANGRAVVRWVWPARCQPQVGTVRTANIQMVN